MIPDLAFIVAIYAIARLIQVSWPAKSSEESKGIHPPNILNLVAILGILYFTYDIYMIGKEAGSTAQKISSEFSNPSSGSSQP